MVAVLVAQDCVLLLVILVVRGAAEVALELVRTVVAADVEEIVMDAKEAVRDVLEAVRECVKVVATAALAVARDGVKEVVELNLIKEGENGKR